MGAVWTLETSVTRTFVADDVIIRIEKDIAEDIAQILCLWMVATSPSDLNETNAIEICRLSDNGVGGTFSGLAQRFELGNLTGDGVEAFHLPDTGWATSQPTVSAVMGGARPFNWANGWIWPGKFPSGPINLTSSNSRLGFRVVRASTVEITARFGFTYRRSGGS